MRSESVLILAGRRCGKTILLRKHSIALQRARWKKLRPNEEDLRTDDECFNECLRYGPKKSRSEKMATFVRKTESRACESHHEKKNMEKVLHDQRKFGLLLVAGSTRSLYSVMTDCTFRVTEKQGK